jgi:hypothetical protein
MRKRPFLVRVSGRIVVGEPVFVSELPEYDVHANMMSRCYRKDVGSYQYYGARGIKVCDRWRNFAYFYEDMAPRPSAEHQLERIDNDGNYEPGNCTWVLRADQQNNKRNTTFVEYEGARTRLHLLCKRLGKDPNLVKQRVRDGWPIEIALNKEKHGRQWKPKELRKKYVRKEQNS